MLSSSPIADAVFFQIDAEVAKRRGAGGGKENKQLHGMFKS